MGGRDFLGKFFFKMDAMFWILVLEILVHRRVVEKMEILGYLGYGQKFSGNLGHGQIWNFLGWVTVVTK